MKVPRYAHWLVVPALVIGMGVVPVGPAWAGPARAPVEAEPEPEPTEPTEPTPTEGAEARTPEGTPTEEEAEPEAPEAAPTEAAPTEAAPTEAAPTEAAPTDAAEAEPAEEPEPAALTPEITVRPQPVAPTPQTLEPVVSDVPPSEVVMDPRRHRRDERIVFRAGLLAFGVAGAALVPTVVGLHQAAEARRVLDRLDTPSEQSTRAEAEGYERSMNRMALVTGVIAASSALAGAVLVGVGVRSWRRTEQAPTVAPAVSPTSAGVVLRGRF